MKTGIILLLAGAMNERIAVAMDLEESLTNAIKNSLYAEPTTKEFARARTLFRETLSSTRPPAQLQTNWAALDFELTEVDADGKRFWLLRDRVGKQRGAGWYLFRHDGQDQTSFQAPHSKNDLETGLISLRLFREGNARALACSTITRHTADMAHLENTYFQAFTLAFADVYPAGLVVQFHGFESANHGGAKCDVVASAGKRSPEPWLGTFADALSKQASLKVFAYPRDGASAGLGGTLNAQNRAWRRSASGEFLHLEMSLRVREQLKKDHQLRHVFLNCLSLVHTP